MKIFKILPVIAFTTLSMQGVVNSYEQNNIVDKRSDSDIIQKLNDIVQNKLPENFSEITVKKGTTIAEIKEFLDVKVREFMKENSDFHINFSIAEIINSIEPGREKEIKCLKSFFEVISIKYSYIRLSIKQFLINIKYVE